ncbi:ubiquitin carboxyl-terminal hydrolase 35/38 [Entomortierella parvispora]|uniref:Ubiquitin carboxyl-terminal hydrolase 35/38 n=1 Tax=Entomortierella parvispora TaxID=205924 RepID=A0A9P3HLC6_9FUNG|nr:ubiquitin carboxyl-terminal hydrolase 35/38 [Entomortierella parvispora]
METLIRSILAASLQPNVKSAAITKLLGGTAQLSTPDASVLLDLGLELKSAAKNVAEIQVGDRIIMAISLAHRQLFFARFHSDWFQSIVTATFTNQDYARNIPLLITVAKRKEACALTEEEKINIEQDMAILHTFSEKSCFGSTNPADHPIQCLFVAMFVNVPASRPLSISKYIEFLVDHLANLPLASAAPPEGPKASKNAILLLQQSWESSPDNVFITIAQLFSNLSDDQRECSLGVGYLLQVVPESFTSVVDPFVQNIDALHLWRLRFTVQRLIDWLVTYDLPGIGVWIVAITESLASRGEFALLRDLATENVYKIARQLAFRARRNDAFMVLRFMLLGYHQSPILFHNVAKGLIPLLVNCRKGPEDAAFATEVCNLAQILVIHFGDTDDVGTKVQKARVFLDLPIVPRAEAIRTMQESSWKKGLQIQNTSAGTRRRAVLVQPLGKVGLVNLGNSCFMNSALRALFCSEEFKQAILGGTLRVDPSKVMTTKLRETFVSLSTSRLTIFTPSALYKALPEWLNDGHQQDAAEFIKILFSRLEDEDPASKKALSSFHGTVVNQIQCGNCGTLSSNTENFYDLAVPIPHADTTADLQRLVDIYPSTEELNEANSNPYFCDQCKSLQSATRRTTLGSLPTNLIISLNRFEFDVKRSRRVKINTPIQLSKSIQLETSGSTFQDRQPPVLSKIQYDLFAVVVHTGDSANHGHYYTYARDNSSQDKLSSNIKASGTTHSSSLVELSKGEECDFKKTTSGDQDGQWLLYNDTSVTLSSFEAVEQAAKSRAADTPYVLFFKKRVENLVRIRRDSNL